MLKFAKGLIGGDIKKFFVGENDFFTEFLESEELVTKFGGFFVIPQFGGSFHILFEFFEEFLAVAFEIADEFIEFLMIFFWRTLSDFDAGSEAEVGVEGLFAVIRLIIVRKDFAEDAESAFDGSLGVEGADITGIIAERLTSNRDVRNFGFGVDANIGNGFIVAKENVPLRHIAFNHFGFEKEGVHFGVDDDPIGIGDFGDEGGGFGVFDGVVEILTDAVFKDGGFADIDNLPAGVFMEVDAGSSGERF